MSDSGQRQHRATSIAKAKLTTIVRPRGLAAITLCCADYLRRLLGHAETPREIAQLAFASVVLIALADANGQPLSLGSGFFVKGDIVATNLHVLEGASSGYAKIIGQNAKHDIVGLSHSTSRETWRCLKISDVAALAASRR